MEPIPDDILKQFNEILEQKAVSSSLRDDYRKWLRYYLDFRIKYPPPDEKSEQCDCLSKKCARKASPEKACTFHLSDKDVQAPLYEAVRKAPRTPSRKAS